jgi:hypothetical protein
MTDGRSRAPPHWLWRGTLGLMALVLTTALALVIALAFGWNSPRPTRSPDWEAPDLPLSLEASPNSTTASLLDCTSGDSILEAEATPLSGSEFNGYGLIYRAQDPTRYYAFAVGGDGYYAVLRVEGDKEAMLVDWQQFPHIRRGGQTNRLRVECKDATCRFFINDEYATSVEDDTWLAGQVGLWVRGFEEHVSVRFLSARVWAPCWPLGT